MTQPDRELIGRDAERREIEGWIGADHRSSGALLLTGEAGIGKTTLWRHAVADARRAGRLVIASSPAESGTQLQFAVLGDLLGDHLREVAPLVPSPQLRALEVALLLREADAAAPEPLAIALAVLSAFKALAAARPLVVAIDDAQWIDKASGAALAFALSRLAEARVDVILAWRRDEDRHGAPLGVEHAFGFGRVRAIEVGPLSIGALHALFRQQLGLTLRRPTLHRVHEASRGNPLYALELARALQRGGAAEGDQLALPSSLREALLEHITKLPAETSEALGLAALSTEPTLALLGEALSVDDLERRLRPAVASGVIEIDDERIRFSHPLLASVAASSVFPQKRREHHRRLALLAPTLEARARHVALATASPDEEAAALLEQAARSAAARGAPAAGADLAEHGRRLTPAGLAAEARRRELLAVECYWTAGDYDRGRRLIDAVIEASSGAERAAVLLRVATNPRTAEESRRFCERALADAPPATGLRARILSWLAALSYVGADVAAGLGYARGAVEAARAAQDGRAALEARACERFLQVLHGEAVELDDLARAAELEVRERGVVLHGISRLYLLALYWTDDVDAARHYGEDLYRRAQQTGSVAGGNALVALATIAYRTGEWRRAGELADEAIAMWSQYGLEVLEEEARSYRDIVDVSMGRIEDAPENARRGLAAVLRTAEPLGEVRHRSALGLLHLSLDDFAAAASELGRALAILRKAAIRNPGAHTTAPYAVAAFVGSGDLASAELATSELEETAAILRSPRSLAMARRCRGLVLAARGEIDAAREQLAEAVAHHAGFPAPFERALTLLALGQAERRGKHKRAAREALGDALHAFEQLPAPLWAEKARRELERIGGRAPSAGGLTPTEQRVATLAAQGKTNREVAAELFLTVGTVEAALTRVYLKLGVRSRTELARRSVASAQSTGAQAAKL